jgi:hypothetical protein
MLWGARVFLGRIAILNVPNDLKRFILFAALPFVLYIPVMMTFQVSGYFPQIRLLWLIVGPQLHAVIAVLLLYIYRKKDHYKWYTYLTIYWFIISSILTTITTENSQIYENYLIAGLVYMLGTVCVTFKIQWKKQQRKE